MIGCYRFLKIVLDPIVLNSISGSFSIYRTTYKAMYNLGYAQNDEIYQGQWYSMISFRSVPAICYSLVFVIIFSANNF